MTTPTHKSYELTTLQDVFEKVPTDRILACLTELGTLMQSTKATYELLVLTAQELAKRDGKEISAELLRPPGFIYPLTWDDDGQGELTTRFSAGIGDEAREIMTMKITKNQHD